MSDYDFNQIRRLDGSLLLVFRELLRRRRATEAAERLGLSPSAVSHALTRLRDLFDDPLFIRRPHGLEPTRRALELGPKVESLIDHVASTLGRETRFDPAATERRFVLSAPEFVTALVGAPLVDAFAREAPKASFVIVSLSQDNALDALRRGEIDVAVGRFSGLAPGLTSEPLYEDRYCVVARKGHPRIDGAIDEETYADVGAVFAMSSAETADDDPVPRHIRVRAFVPRWLGVLVMVSATDAIGSCPRRLAERQADVLNLQVLDPPSKGRAIAISAVRRAESGDAGVDWFLDRVRAAVA